jgi:hypothetical protein
LPLRKKGYASSCRLTSMPTVAGGIELSPSPEAGVGGFFPALNALLTIENITNVTMSIHIKKIVNNTRRIL